jgi:hypothetical protein
LGGQSLLIDEFWGEKKALIRAVRGYAESQMRSAGEEIPIDWNENPNQLPARMVINSAVFRTHGT